MRQLIPVALALLTLMPATAGAQQQGAARADFSTPDGVVKTMIAAVAAKDADLLSQCFSVSSEGEFKPAREKRLSEDDWKDWQGLMAGAEVLEVLPRPDQPDQGVVRVQLKEREERIYVAKEQGAWRILGF